MTDLRTKRQHLQSFLLRHGRIYSGSRPWTQVHARWLSNLGFEHRPGSGPARNRQAIDDAETRLERLTQAVAEVVSSGRNSAGVQASIPARCRLSDGGRLRGGNKRCAPLREPRQLMAYLVLVPSERWTGAQVWRGPVTKAGKPRARRVLIEGAWTTVTRLA